MRRHFSLDSWAQTWKGKSVEGVSFNFNTDSLTYIYIYIYIYMVDSHESDAYWQKNDFVAQS